MITHYFDIIKAHCQKHILLYLSFAFIVIRCGYLSIGFINDDYQILNYHLFHNASDILRPFFEKDISYTYWRPVPNSFQTLLLFLFGFNAFIFRLASFTLYYISALLVYRLSSMIANKASKSSLSLPAIVTLLFIAVPANDWLIGWIAGLGDIFSFIFILATEIFIIKYYENKSTFFYMCVTLFATLAILSKETGFLTLFLPELTLIIHNKEKRPKLSQALFLNSSIGVAAIILFLFRIFLISANLINSSNLSHMSVLNSLINILLYPASALLSPNILDLVIQFCRLHLLMLISISIVCLCLAIYVLFKSQISKDSRRLALFGLLWFLLFIGPGLPLFMRWYGYVSAFGVLFFISILLTQLQLSNKVKYILTTAITTLTIAIFAIISIYQSQLWNQCSEVQSVILNQISAYNLRNYRTITIWGLPEKISSINCFKSGVEEAVQYYANNKSIRVFTPVKAEFTKNNTQALYNINKNEVTIKCSNAMFFPENITKKERYSSNTQIKSNEFYSYKIEPHSGSPVLTVAILKFVPENLNLFLAGKKIFYR